MSNAINLRHALIFLFLLLCAYLPGLTINIMDVDAAQYASISREMLENGSRLVVKDRMHDYLDKPPLLFWLSSWSFQLFGVSNWSYKLPSFLFSVLGVWATWGLGKLLYNRSVGAVAAVMLATTLSFFVFNNDIRTDTILCGSVIFAIWQIMLYLKTKRWYNLLFGFAAIGCAMLSKGPLGLVIPALALSVDFAYRRQWRNFFRWEWLVGLVIVGSLLTPMCIGLYRQWGSEGLYFYFWKQSFGRITGENSWKNDAGFFFFFHTYLWAFFPWVFVLLPALWKNFGMAIRSRFKAGILPELLTTGGFALTFLALSVSKYKLPHYIYVTFPLAALVAAKFFVQDVLPGTKKILPLVFRGLFLFFIVALAAACGLVLFYAFPKPIWTTVLLSGGMFAAALYYFFRGASPSERLLYPIWCAMAAAFFTVNLHFYPRLLDYQSTSEAGEIVADNKVPVGDFWIHHDLGEYSMDFSSRRTIIYVRDLKRNLDSSLTRFGKVWVYTDSSGLAEIQSTGYVINRRWDFDHYGVQLLSLKFLNPKTRPQTLRKRYLLEISNHLIFAGRTSPCWKPEARSRMPEAGFALRHSVFS